MSRHVVLRLLGLLRSSTAAESGGSRSDHHPEPGVDRLLVSALWDAAARRAVHARRRATACCAASYSEPGSGLVRSRARVTARRRIVTAASSRSERPAVGPVRNCCFGSRKRTVAHAVSARRGASSCGSPWRSRSLPPRDDHWSSSLVRNHASTAEKSAQLCASRGLWPGPRRGNRAQRALPSSFAVVHAHVHDHYGCGLAVMPVSAFWHCRCRTAVG